MNNYKVNILGIQFHNVTENEALKKVLHYLTGNDSKVVFTANPEIVMRAKNDDQFKKIINQGDLVVADGIGVVIGSKIIKKPLKERVAGYDLVQNIFKEIKDTEHTVYFFGAAPGIAKQAQEKMKQQYSNIKIIGAHSGYYTEEEEALLIQELKRKKPDIILVGLGAPKQEMWIQKYKNEIKAKVFIGVGGSFDVMSGNTKRAPKLFIHLGLEWFYRLITQPTRLKRMLQLPLFLWEVLIRGRRYSEK